MLGIELGDAHAFQMGEFIRRREQQRGQRRGALAVFRYPSVDVEKTIHRRARLIVIRMVHDRRSAFDISAAIVFERHAATREAHTGDEVFALRREKVLNRRASRELEAERVTENFRGVEPVVRKPKPVSFELPPPHHRRVELRGQVGLDHLHRLGLVDGRRVIRDPTPRDEVGQTGKPPGNEKRPARDPAGSRRDELTERAGHRREERSPRAAERRRRRLPRALPRPYPAWRARLWNDDWD